MPLWGMIFVAYIADLIFGDPLCLAHPVQAIGWMIERLEPILRRWMKNEKFAGGVLAFLVVLSVWGVVYGMITLGAYVHVYLGNLISIYFIYSALATKDLGVESFRVYRALQSNDIDQARKNLALIVGRDTNFLDRKEIIRATVETVAENIVDGVVAPFFYAFIGGAPFALAYKAINTLDSMVGYKNKKYQDFGFVSAKIDDAFNFVPARLAALSMFCASFFAGKDFFNAFKILRRDRKNHPSPNSGIPESIVAGALGVQLGGVSHYQGQESLKPLIGDAKVPFRLKNISDSIRINQITSGLVLFFGVIVLLTL